MAGKSYTRLAEESGYAPTTISHTLSGTRFPGLTEPLLRRALKILELCGATSDDTAAWERFHADLAAWARRDASGTPPQPPRPPGTEPTEQPELSDQVKALLATQLDDGESVPYLLPVGRLPHLSEVYIRQLLGPDDSDETADTTARPAHDVVVGAPKHLLVVAGPGGGKSTLVRRLAGALGTAWLEQDSPPPLVPIWVTATELARQPDTIESKLIPESLPPGLRWLALVDGVDEIVEATRRRDFILKLARLAKRHRSDLQLLITTRPLPRDEDSKLREEGVIPYTLEPFDRPRFIDFAERWFGDSATAADYIRQVDRACLGPLVSIPLLATITAVVYEAYPNSPLPGNQYLLYEQYRRHLIRIKEPQLREQWQRLEEVARFEIPRAAETIRKLAARNGVDLLHHLAVEQTTRAVDGLTNIALKWLDDRLDTRASYLILDWPEYVRGILAGTGMLLRAGSDVRFLHTSFAEHLAAEYRAQQLPETNSFEEPSWLAVIQRARAHDEAALATLIHAAHRSTTRARGLLELMQVGTNADRLVAAHLLAEGPILDDTHARWFLSQLEVADPDLDLDWWSLASRIGHPEIAKRLTELAHQPSERRYAAAAALAAHRPEVAGFELAKIVQSDTEPWENRCDALRALIRLGDQRAQQAALILRDKLLEQDRDRLDIEYGISALEEIWPVDELERFFRERSTLPNGSVLFVALSALASLSEESREEASSLLFSLIDPADIDSIDSREAILLLKQIPGGETKVSYLLASAPLRLKEQLELVKREVQLGVLDQETVVGMLARTAGLPRWYEFSSNAEVFESAQCLRQLLNDIHDDVKPSLCSVLQWNVMLCRDVRLRGQVILFVLMVAGWEFIRGCEWGEYRSGNIVKKVLGEAARFSGGRTPWDDWYGDASRFSAHGYGSDFDSRSDLEVPNGWGEWIGWLALSMSEIDAPPWSEIDKLVSFAVDRSIPNAGRSVVVLMVVLLLCVPYTRIDSGARANRVRFLADEFPSLGFRLREISRLIEREL
ncbi:NACHT domain-containing protein [Streptomyces hokutonensis]|uniref:NACHT domain-containing protein n=1 Tax=Streptomyces hokutonensis TaxID=1306990 RepID=A0ABW6MB57_9ACTN